jgi:RNA polymerase sigma factor (sigma-70 family)
MNEPLTPTIATLLRHQKWLRRVAASLAVDSAQADDLTQQALLAALERPPADARRPRAWLRAVVQNVARRFGNRERRRLAREQFAVAAPAELAPPTDAVVERAALQTEVATALLALAEPYRTALLLRFFEELPPRAIAKRTGAPVETVRTRIKRGLELLRAELVRRRGEGARAAGRPEAAREWGVALIGLLDPGLRRAVRRALLAKAGGAAGAGAGFAGATTFAGLMGVLGMSTPMKLAAALAVVAGGTFAVVKLAESPKLPPREGVAQAARGAVDRAAPEEGGAPKLPPPEIATRAAESREPSKEAPAKGPPETLAGVVEGIVVTPRGEPAVGATVLLEDAAHHGDFGTLDDLCMGVDRLLTEPMKPKGMRQRTLTEKGGTFRFTDLLPGGSVNVAAIAGDAGTGLLPGVVVLRDAAPTRIEIRLVEGVVLHGTVTDEQGVPIAKADLRLNRFARVGNGTQSSSLLSLKSADDGSYRTISLPCRSFTLGVWAEGFFGESPPPIELLESEHDRVVDVRMTRAVTLRGRVLGPDGQPAGLAHAGNEIWIAWSDDDPRTMTSIELLSGQRGKLDREADRYEVTPSEKGARFVSVVAADVILGSSPIVDAGVGPDVVVDLSKVPAATPKGTLSIEVVSARDGVPVPFFHAEARSDPTGVRDPRAAFETHQGDGKEGRLEIPDLRVGPYDLSVRAKGFVARFVVAQVTAPSATTRVELHPATGFVHGRVEDENGRPVAGAKLFLLAPDGRVASPWPECNTAADAEGGFTFKEVAEGSCTVVAEHDGLAPASAAAVATAKGDGSRTDVVLTMRSGVTVDVEPRGRGVETSGPFMYRIRDERGAPVVDHHRCPGFLTTVSGRGASPFKLAPGNYTVEVFCPKFAPGKAAFSATEGKVVEVELLPLEEPAAGR